MALDYTTLQTEILAVAKRPTLTSEVVSCIRRAEGMIRRELLGYELQATIQESDRVSNGVYNAPSYLHYVQSISTTDADGDEYPLNRVGLNNIYRLSASASLLEYAVYNDFIEFRGVPATDKEMRCNYIGHPAPLDVTSTNALLTDHEEIYISGALFQLYAGYIEAAELAQGQLDIFNNAVDGLNMAIRRKLGGGVRSYGYNLGNLRTQRGY